MSEESIRALIDRFNQAWNERDLDGALAMTSADALFESTGPAPDGVEHRGRAAVREAWAPIFENPASHFDVEEIVVMGDRAVQRFRYSWGEGHVRGIDLFAFDNGLITEKRSYVKG
ncbi:MAG: nuclear transport factor 2 family protein [Acidimicrobiales bacterium]